MEKYAMLGKIMERIIGLPLGTLMVLYDLVEKLLGPNGLKQLQEFKKFLRKENCWIRIVEKIYCVIVDYSAEDERYDKYYRDFGLHNSFSFEKSGKEQVNIELFEFDHWVSNADVILEMQRVGYFPVGLRELAALDDQTAEEFDFMIVALGSHMDMPIAQPQFPVLSKVRNSSKRSIYFLESASGWKAGCRFAAAPKKKS